jgi:hypothetical protein
LSALGLSLIALSAFACEVSEAEDPDNEGSEAGRPSDGGAGNGAGDDDPSNGEGGAPSPGNGGAGGSSSDEPGDVPGGAGSDGGTGGQTDEPDEPDEPDEDPPPVGASSRFFLPMTEPTNTSAPTVELDAQGGIHSVYPRYVIGGAFYAYCASDCESSEDLSVVELETDGTVHNSMLALNQDGQPRVLLSTATKVYYASCDAGCDSSDGWQTTEILDHAGDREVTGEALALDPEGRPRFLMHTYRAFLGIGQKPRLTFYVSCDDDCHEPASWTASQIATQTWEGTHLRYDAEGRAHIATVANVEEDGAVTRKLGAYSTCEADCDVEENWVGTGLYEAYESSTDAVAMHPTVALALTRAGTPRLLVLGKNADGNRNIVYFECDEGCTGDNWTGSIISDHESIDTGLDLALDQNDRPRFAYTLGFNIVLAYCDQADCTSEMAQWDLTKVEFGSDIPADDIFLWDNCTVGAWFLHSPSIALGAGGEPRIGYQARDISGGLSQPDPTKPGCVAGTDMTWSRLAVMPSYKE